MNTRDYSRDITEIRSMMERSSKFLSLSGWAGIMAGLYALTGAWVAYSRFNFYPDGVYYSPSELPEIIMLALLILVLALSTAFYLSWRKSDNRGEKVWNATSRRLLTQMAVPLVTGGILILVFISKGLIGLIAPLSLLFYGLALYNAGNFTFNAIKVLGIIQIALGLLSSWLIGYGLLLWAFGFGVMHVVYGIYIHIRYER
ncbi:hypothetical protein BH23BAC3_BH23BAC3_02310 [soil metagenome]